MVFLEYDVRQVIVSNSGQQSYTLPYRAIVMCGDLRPDEQENIQVWVQSNNVIDGSADGSLNFLMSHTSSGSRAVGMSGCYVAQAGDIVRVDASDDVQVNLYIFRLPEENR